MYGLVWACWEKAGHLGLKATIPVQTELLMTEGMDHESCQHKNNESWVFLVTGDFSDQDGTKTYIIHFTFYKDGLIYLYYILNYSL